MQEQFVIEGNHRLQGEVTVSGNKNAAIKMLPACLLTDEPVILNNMPDIADVRTTLELLRKLGADIQFNGAFQMSAGEGLRGADILLDEASVTATENAIMASSLNLFRHRRLTFRPLPTLRESTRQAANNPTTHHVNSPSSGRRFKSGGSIMTTPTFQVAHTSAMAAADAFSDVMSMRALVPIRKSNSAREGIITSAPIDTETKPIAAR